MFPLRCTVALFGLLLGVLVVAAPAQASPGDLDAGFGRSGLVEFGVPGSFVLRGFATQSDGSTVVGTGVDSFLIRRLTPGGEVDESFAGSGSIGFAGSDQHYYGIDALAIDGQDRVVALVRHIDWTTGEDSKSVYRYLPNGQPDESFGADGEADLASMGASGGWRLGIDSHDRIVLGASRLREDGSLDTGFGHDGFASLFDRPETDLVDLFDFSVSPDDSVLITGAQSNFLGRVVVYSLYLERLDGDGHAVPSFGDEGILRSGLFGTWINAVPGAAGSAYISAGSNVRRLLPDGSTDPSFDYEASGVGDAYDLAADGAGRLLILGSGAPDTGFAPTATVQRLLPSGELDPAFGDGGRTFVYGRRGKPVRTYELAVGPGETVSGWDYESLWRMTIAAGPSDLDADGVLDPQDVCPWLPASGGHGCPRLKSTMTAPALKQPDGPATAYLYGRISADLPACSADVDVKIVREAQGRREVFASVKTTSVGRWRVIGKVPPGVYVARAARHDEGGHGFCMRAQSPAFDLAR